MEKIKFFNSEDFLARSGIPDELRYAAEEYIDSFSSSDTDVAFSYFSGTLIIRYYSDEGGYYFSPPYPLCEDADQASAFVKLSEYCTLESVREVIVDLLPEELPLALRGAEHYDAEELDDGTVALSIYTECMLCEELPEAFAGDVQLSALDDEFADEYEKLVRDVNLNKHFGYSYCDDMPDGNGSDFISMASADFDKGESMTFGAYILCEGERRLCGEGCIYGFDGRGGACVSFRVLPEYHRRGIGRSIFDGLRHIAALIGLSRIVADAALENLGSLALLSSYKSGESVGDKVRFIFNIIYEG